MQTVRTSEELAQVRASAEGKVALVPTMGALHAGHMALVEEAKRRTDRIVATIFVNPIQFGENEDLERYPRQEEEDSRKLEQAGCDLLWMPTVQEIYPDGFATTVRVSDLSDRWEGETRPGHFEGVATVVAKLLMSVRPDLALFGEKDFQQLAVIRRMVRDLNIPCEVVAVPTVREEDGLAMSSRNAYLSTEERVRATGLHRSLRRARSSILMGQPVDAALGEGRSALLLSGFSRIDYFALVDPEKLQSISSPKPGARLIAAAVIGTTRLIDNLPL